MSDHGHRDGPIEEIHLPAPSLVPMFTAAGITLALVGLILAWPFVVVGCLITLFSLARWLLDVRRDIERLPAEHR